MKKRLIMMVMALLPLSSCLYEYDPETGQDFGRLVIEGDISLGEVCYFTVSKVNPFNPDYDKLKEGRNVEYALFTVEDELGNSYSAETGGMMYGGAYTYSPTAAIDLSSAPTDRKYRLRVKVKRTVDADIAEYRTPWMTPEPAPVIGDLEEHKLDRDGDGTMDHLSLGLSLSAENTSGCYRWDYEELFYFKADLDAPSLEYDADSARVIDHSMDMVRLDWWPYTYCWRQQHSYRTEVAIAKALEGWNLQDHEFMTMSLTSLALQEGKYYIRLIAKTIPEEEYRYLRAVNRNSENVGSLLTPVPGETVGNIRNVADSTDYAIGYVGASVNARRILKVNTTGRRSYLDPSRFYYNPYLQPFDIRATIEEINRNAYAHGYLPYRNVDDVNYWVPRSCIDCRMMSGTIEKPDGWEM
ncbi:MAG: DUF4249 family protein [Bacteroidales bacterium]|nr:DUF4249 family protein [Bacteroidales bacterium]